MNHETVIGDSDEFSDPVVAGIRREPPQPGKQADPPDLRTRDRVQSAGLALACALFLLLSLAYYFYLSACLAIGMLIYCAIMYVALYWLAGSTDHLLQIYTALFIIAWIGQFIGHSIEGKRPSFFRDIQFLMIGPLWLLSAVYRKLNIRY